MSYAEITDLTGCMCCQYKIKYQKHYKSNEKFPSKATISGLVGFIELSFGVVKSFTRTAISKSAPNFENLSSDALHVQTGA